MKRILTLTAATLIATVGAASAMTGPSSFDTLEIQSYAPNANIAALSAAQVNAVLNIIHSGDDSGKTAAVRSYLRHAS